MCDGFAQRRMQKSLDCFLTSSEGPSVSASSTCTHSYSDNEKKYCDDDMSNYSTSNEDLERSDDDKQSHMTYFSNEGCTEDEDKMSTDELDKETELKQQRKIMHHQKTGISSDWPNQFKWLQKVQGKDDKLGMICKLC